MKKILTILAVLTLFAVTYNPAFATQAAEVTSQAPTNSGVTSNPPAKEIPKLGNPIKVNSIEELLFTVVDVAIFVGVLIAIFVFVYIGFKFVMAQGDPGAIKEAKQWFLYAVIGTALLIGSRLLVDVIKNTVTKAGLVNESLFQKK